MRPLFSSRTLSAVLLLAVATVAQAGNTIYRLVDEDGHVQFTNVPPDSRYKMYLRDSKTPDAMEKALARPVRHFDAKARERYAKHIEDAAQATSVDAALIHAVISVESGYNPLARSNRGARGLMQLMPETAKRYGVKNSLDPAQNIAGGARYLKDLITLFNNNVELALAAYNAGEHAVINYGNRIPPYRETIAYIPRVLTYYKKYRALTAS
jgi:soluble lytic murein transglycosylase-like protein